MKKIWNCLNGNKTIICTILLYILSKDVIPISQAWSQIVEYILLTLGGGSLAHHIGKGSFKPDTDIAVKDNVTS